MKTNSLHNISRRTRRCHALTILEMLVSTALLSFIVLGLTAMFIQTQKVFKTGIKQATITDAGRSVIDMIAADLSQMSDPHFTNVLNLDYPSAVATAPPTLDFSWDYTLNLRQYTNNYNGVPVACRTNIVEDIFAVLQTNSTWVGVGYAISNWFTNTSTGVEYPGVGTLYRYVITTNSPLTNNSTGLIQGFGTAVNTSFTNCHRIADGVVHLAITAYDANGNQSQFQLNYPNGPIQYPNVTKLPTSPVTYQTNYLPHSIDIELGILEPEAFEHARALFSAGAIPAASNYLAMAVGQVEIFRQHIIIPAAP